MLIHRLHSIVAAFLQLQPIGLVPHQVHNSQCICSPPMQPLQPQAMPKLHHLSPHTMAVRVKCGQPG